MIPTIDPDDQARMLRVLIYGDTGTGKTQLAATASGDEELSPVLIMNLEGGVMTAAKRKGVKSTKLLTSSKEVISTLISLSIGTEPYKTVVVDSVSALCQIVKQELETKGGSGEVSEFKTGKKVKEAMAPILRQMCALDMHVIALARVREMYPESHPPAMRARKEGLISVHPDVPPAVSKELRHLFDGVWLLAGTGLEERNLLTSPLPPYREIRTRLEAFERALGGVVKNPTIPNIYATQLAALEGETDAVE